MKPGRNDSCPCGSGKKYKQCCALAEAESAESMDRLIAKARDALQRGALQDALAIGRRLIKVAPNHAESNHLCGLIHYMAGELPAAQTYFTHAVRLAPDEAVWFSDLSHVQCLLGEHTSAVQSARNALSLDAALADAHNHLANALYAQGSATESVEHYHKAVEIEPSKAPFRVNLAVALQQTGNVDAAEREYRAAIRLDPAFAPGHANLGSLLIQRNRPQEAVEEFSRAIELNPADVKTLANLGLAYLSIDNLAAAKRSLERAINVYPRYATAYLNLALVYEKAKKGDDAIRMYESALSLSPELTSARKNLLALTFNRKDLNRSYDLAKGLLLEPVLESRYLSAMLQIFGSTFDFDLREKCFRLLMHLDPRAEPQASFEPGILLEANYSDLLSEETVVGLHRLWGEQQEAASIGAQFETYSRQVPNGRIRIGYVSPDFRHHSVGYFIENVLLSHDPQRFEIYCYSTSLMRDEITDRIEKCVARFRVVAKETDDALAHQIHGDRIDILVDLVGHVPGGRMRVFARRPAPVQITYLGYPNTTGLQAIDYRVSDSYADPSDPLGHTESVLRLPESFLCFGSFPEFSEYPSAPCLRNGWVTFGSFNNLSKVTRSVIQSWAAILARTPRSRLLIRGSTAQLEITQTNLRTTFSKLGIDSERLILIGWDPSTIDHLLRYNDVDIALDPYPYGGTTTTCQALWMGVPVITYAGGAHRQRVSYSILRNIGVTETSAASESEYVERAVALATDIQHLSGMRSRIRERIRGSILCDPLRFTNQLEEAYLQAWYEKGRHRIATVGK